MLGDDHTSPYDVAVSLGSDCQVAHRLQESVPSFKSGPFDWLLTPFLSLVQALERDFDEFMLPAHLYRPDKENGRVVQDRHYGVISVHDFIESTPLNNIEVQQKYQHTAENLRQVLRSNARVLLIRKDLRRRQAEELSSVLGRLYPQLSWTLLALMNTSEPSWKLPRVNNVFLKTTSHWTGDEKSWARLLTPFHANTKETQHGRRR